MTFSPAERELVRRYLGYPLNAQAIAYVATRCDQVQALGSEVVETIRGILRELGRLDQQIKNAAPFASQTFNSGAGGTQQYLPGARLQTLKDEAKRYVSELADSLQLPAQRDIYSAGNGPARSTR